LGTDNASDAMSYGETQEGYSAIDDHRVTVLEGKVSTHAKVGKQAGQWWLVVRVQAGEVVW
jgi:hypothetical protein